MNNFQTEFTELMARRKLNQTAVSRLTGVSQAWVNRIVKSGRVPSFQTLQQLADGLDLEPAERARLMRAANYAEPAPLPGVPPHVADIADQVARLDPRRQAVIQRLLRSPESIDGVGLLIDARVARGRRGAGEALALA